MGWLIFDICLLVGGYALGVAAPPDGLASIDRRLTIVNSRDNYFACRRLLTRP